MINLNGEFVWWMGVVEDINDPEVIGRARVRIIGYHTADKEVLPTVSLPWAHPVFPITSASNRGKGLTVPGLLPGSHVFGFFLDGTDAQQPVILGSVPGINTEENDPAKGFNIPETYESLIKDNYKGKPDTNLLAYGKDDSEQRATFVKDNMYLEEVETAFPEVTWNEPMSQANPEFPNNKVYESTSGHLIEIDDTPEGERIHVMHNQGGYIEFHPDGTLVIKSTNEGYNITLGDNNMFVAGTLNISALGNVAIKAQNFMFKGNKANFELEDDFVVNCKNFNVKADEGVAFGAANGDMGVCAGGKIELANGGNARIVMEGKDINLNPPG